MTLLIITSIAVLVVMCVVACVLEIIERRSTHRTRQQRERLRIQHEQFLAEMRLAHMTQSALQHMLDTARQEQQGRESSWQG